MFTTERRPRPDGGWPKTIATMISSAMTELEAAYSEREASWFFAGYEFCANGPQTWFVTGQPHVIMQLSFGSQSSWRCAAYELAHECVHLLAPRPFSTNLEEGLATHFAEDFCLRHSGEAHQTTEPRYVAARDAVRRLLGSTPEVIRLLRQNRKSLSELSATDILTVATALSIDDARFLATVFHPLPSPPAQPVS